MEGVICGQCGGPWFPHCGCLWQCGTSLDFRPRQDGTYRDGEGKLRRPKQKKKGAA